MLIQVIIVWGRRYIEETRVSQPACDRDKIEYNMRRSRKVRYDVLRDDIHKYTFPKTLCTI